MQVIPVLEMGFDSDKNKLSWNHEYKAPTPTYKDKRQTVNEDENLRSNPRRLFSQLQRREFHFPFCYRESRPIPQLRLLINGESLVISRWRARPRLTQRNQKGAIKLLTKLEKDPRLGAVDVKRCPQKLFPRVEVFVSVVLEIVSLMKKSFAKMLKFSRLPSRARKACN